jgi:hypothetical protein
MVLPSNHSYPDPLPAGMALPRNATGSLDRFHQSEIVLQASRGDVSPERSH